MLLKSKAKVGSTIPKEGGVFQVTQVELLGCEPDFLPRPDAEKDASRLQIIPYCVLVTGDTYADAQILQYTRGKKGGEARLHAKKSIGLGGHINPCDVLIHGTHTISLPALQVAARRELQEEIGAQEKDLEFIGDLGVLLTTDMNSCPEGEAVQVGDVHVGLLMAFRFTGTNIAAEEIVDPVLRSPADLLKEESLEDWSKLAVSQLERIGSMWPAPGLKCQIAPVRSKTEYYGDYHAVVPGANVNWTQEQAQALSDKIATHPLIGEDFALLPDKPGKNARQVLKGLTAIADHSGTNVLLVTLGTLQFLVLVSRTPGYLRAMDVHVEMPNPEYQNSVTFLVAESDIQNGHSYAGLTNQLKSPGNYRVDNSKVHISNPVGTISIDPIGRSVFLTHEVELSGEDKRHIYMLGNYTEYVLELPEGQIMDEKSLFAMYGGTPGDGGPEDMDQDN